jgi:hypothetical protein
MLAMFLGIALSDSRSSLSEAMKNRFLRLGTIQS